MFAVGQDFFFPVSLLFLANMKCFISALWTIIILVKSPTVREKEDLAAILKNEKKK